MQRPGHVPWTSFAAGSGDPSLARAGHPGPHNVGRVMEYDLEAGGIGPLRRAGRWLNPDTWRGFDRLFGR